MVGAGSWLEEAGHGLLLMADLFGWNLLSLLGGQLGTSAVLQRVGALLDLIDLLALDLGPPPEHLHTLPLEQAEPRGEERCGYCCISCSCCCQAQWLRLFL